MSIILILLAAGDGKRLKSNIPKPYVKVNNKTLLEYSLNCFENISQIKIRVEIENKSQFIEEIKKII